ncbi:glycolate oxidase subunit GlcE [Rhizobium sp. CRIBSB]|nr:glycolate oxidase subunit GlcE [Rhizobium sp. CRIBSB]
MDLPRTTEDVLGLITDATTQGRRLEITGGGTHRHVGAPRPDARLLGTSALTGIVDYDPAELVMTVRAGTPLAELEAALAEQGQGFMFEPSGAAGATIGGVIGASVSGSRRVSAGAVRDFVLGFEAVSGRGERFKAGGKVVKNVTGFDLSKLVCGSWGRLAVLTEVTLKVLPAPAECRTLSWTGLDTAAAWDLMGEAMCAPADVAAAAWRPDPGVAQLRLEGFGPSVDARTLTLTALLSRFGAPVETTGEAAMAAWHSVQQGEDLSDAPILWRLSVPRSAGLVVARRLDALNCRWIADWAGGLIWAATDAEAGEIRALAASAGGHATLVRAPETVRSRVPAFHPQPKAMAALSERVRRAFDPQGLFETGRFLDTHDAD